MSIVSIPAVFMAGAVVCMCAHNILVYLRVRDRREHLAFAVTCLFIALYAAATAGLYSAASPEDGQFWQRLQVTAVIYAAIAFVWFISLYTGQLAGFIRNTFSIYYALSSLVLWFDRSGLSWPGDRPSVKHINLPFGWHVVYQEMAPGPLVEITSAIGLVFLAYILRACLRFYRAGHKTKARVLLWAILLFVFGVANDMAVTVGMYKFIYLIEYAYFGMVLLIDQALTRDMLETVRLRQGRVADEGRYKRMFQHVDDVYFEVSPEGRILDVSPSVQRVTGLSREEVIGRIADDFYARPEERAELRRRIREQGRVEGLDMHFRLGNGREADFCISATLVAGTQDGPPRVVGSLRDVTRRKEAETALARAAHLHERMRGLAKTLDSAQSLNAGLNEALQTMMEMAGWREGAVYVVTRGRPVLRARQHLPYAAAKALESLPIEEEDVLEALSTGRPVALGSLAWDFLAMPELRNYQGAHVVSCVSGDRLVGYLVLASSSGRESRDALEAETAVASETGTFIARCFFIEAVQRREEQYRRAQEFAHVGSWEYDVSDGKLRGSFETSRIFGFSEDIEAVTLTELSDVIHPADRDRIVAAFGDFVNGAVDTYDVEYRIIRQTDKTTRTVHSLAQGVEDDAGRISKVLGTVQDVTEEKQLQQQLMLAQRMESVGLLAGGIAHDFNNILSVILSYSDLLLRGMDSSDPKYAMIHEIGQAGERASHLTQQLLAFSRRQIMEMRVIDLNAVLREMGPMFERLISERIELRLELDDSLRPVQADASQVQQIMMNLVVNGRDAMPDGGILTIATRCAIIDKPDRGQPPNCPAPGEYSTISVSDTGTGMESGVLDRVFDPFFTTKAAGEGTGLGLATVYGIVKQHGGYISAESTPGKGSRFQVYFPAVDQAPERDAQPKVPDTDARGTETILVVEDEEMVRDLTSNVLQRHGYVVLTAEDGETALAVAASCGQPIQLLLTDIVMPGMNGRELYEQLAPRQPGMKVLFMSGYLNEIVSDRSSPGADSAFLQKPFTVQTLTEKVRSILDS